MRSWSRTRPFVPVDVGAERLSQDEKLGTLVGHLLRLWREYDWMCFVGKGDKGKKFPASRKIGSSGPLAGLDLT